MNGNSASCAGRYPAYASQRMRTGHVKFQGRGSQQPGAQARWRGNGQESRVEVAVAQLLGEARRSR